MIITSILNILYRSTSSRWISRAYIILSEKRLIFFVFIFNKFMSTEYSIAANNMNIL